MKRYKQYQQTFSLVLLINLLCLFSLSTSAEELELFPNQKIASIANHVSFIIDQDSELSAKQVSASTELKTLKQANLTKAFVGNVAGSVWLKLEIKNVSDEFVDIQIQSPTTTPSIMALYHRPLGSNLDFEKITDDIRHNLTKRALPTARVSLPLKLQPNETREVLIESFSDVPTPRYLNFQLVSLPVLIHSSNIEHIIFGMVMSLILVSALFSLMAYKFLEEKFFIWYSLFAISTLPALGLTTGIINLYIPNLDFYPLGTLSFAVMIASGIQFMRVYSNVAYHSLKTDKLIYITLILTLTTVPLSILGFDHKAQQVQQLAVFIFPFALIAAGLTARQGEKKMSAMLIAQTLLFGLLVLINMQSWGWVDPYAGMVFLPTIGILSVLLCLIFAMYIKAKAHYYEGSKEDLDTIASAYKEAYALQEQVKEQNQQLKVAKEQAEFEARTDMLTQMPNRRAFMNLATMAIAQSMRQGKPLSFIAFDIDNFKKINDHYGHPAGDETLRIIGELTKQIIRVSDFCGRIGGEEFMIGCHNNHKDDAEILAERLRMAIEKTVIKADGHEFTTTISLGIANVTSDDDLESVIKKSDIAMYLSKTTGKNKVTNYAA
ncbi:diguanylate cyclase [Thalassotalea aquiviva]|uniref:diguanylate cyclase n=1 Tax=Thalassotalea aquiviva TaxID=3242415 RepID=UPI00352B9C42